VLHQEFFVVLKIPPLEEDDLPPGFPGKLVEKGD
jgi:hypothetical protein